MSAPYPPAIADLLLRKKQQGCTALLQLWPVADGWVVAPAPAGCDGVDPRQLGPGQALACARALCAQYAAAVQQGAPL